MALTGKRTTATLLKDIPPGLLSTSAEYASESQLCAITELSASFWQKDRWLHQGKAPGCPFYKFGRSVRYNLKEALEWLRDKETQNEARDSRRAALLARRQS